MSSLTAVSPTNLQEPLLSSGDRQPTGPPFSRGKGLLNRFKNAVNPLNHPPRRRELLIQGAKNGNVNMVESALNAGADVNATLFDTRRLINERLTPLHYASLRGHLDVVRALLAWHATVDARDIADHTPLHAASMRGHLDVVQLLLDYKANANLENVHGQTPLNIANTDEIKELLKEAMRGTPAIGGRRRRRYTQTKRTKRKTNTRKK